MADADPLAAALAEVQALVSDRDKLVARVNNEPVDIRVFNAAQDRLAGRVPLLLAAVEAALEEAARWEAETEGPESALTEDRAWIRSACGRRLRLAIIRKLCGEAACRHCGDRIERCKHEPRAGGDHGWCKGWRHTGYETQPFIGHYCGGRSINPPAEPQLEEERTDGRA